MESTRFLIIGGGISGLAFADWLNTDEYLICEADDELGGYCKTVRQDGFVWDYSGHFFHFRRPEIEKYLVERMQGQKILEVQKQSRIWYANRLVDFPFQKNIHQLPKDEFIDCLYDLYFRDEGAGRENFKAMLYAKFGKSIAEKFLVPYNEKLYATDLSHLDVDAMGRFFPYAEVADIIANFKQQDNRSYNATFTYPEGGAIQYVHALAAGVDSARVHLGRRITSIDLRNRIATTTAGDIRFESLISSAPFVKLMEMASVDFDRKIYSWNVVQVFNLGFDRKGISGVHWVYFPQRDLSFYRVGFYDNIFGNDRMSLYVELGRSVGFEPTPNEIETDRQHVLEDLRAAGIIEAHQLVSSHHIVLNPAYVHITTDSNRDVEQKKAALEQQGVYSIGRYGSWTYCSIEDNIVEARELAERLTAP